MLQLGRPVSETYEAESDSFKRPCQVINLLTRMIRQMPVARARASHPEAWRGWNSHGEDERFHDELGTSSVNTPAQTFI